MFQKLFLLLLGVVVVAVSQTIESAEYCGECHVQNFVDWKHSRHANSTRTNNPFFAKMYQKANQETEGQAADRCLKCHEPVRFMGVPEITAESLVHEGLTCDICHAAKRTGRGKDAWFELQPGNVKFGPYKDGISSEHECEYHPDILTADHCLVCHGTETNAHGIAFCSTENEYKNSSYAKSDVTCQDCHMPVSVGKVAELGKIRQIASHEFLGGYDESFLKDCASVQLNAHNTDNGINLIIEITNETVGHALPTGSPLRVVYLEITAFDAEENIVWKNFKTDPIVEDPQTVFMRLLEDDQANAPVPPWRATHVRFDQRLQPDETRLLEYEFPGIAISRFEAVLKYRLLPPAIAAQMGLNDPPYTTALTITEANTNVQ